MQHEVSLLASHHFDSHNLESHFQTTLILTFLSKEDQNYNQIIAFYLA